MSPPALRAALATALLDLDEAEVTELLHAIEDPAEFADQVLAPVLEELGEGWEQGTIALSQVFMAGRVLERALKARQTHGGPHAREGVIAIGVLGDYHALGKSIVSTALVCAGHDVRDLGSGLTPQQLVDGALAANARVLMVSVLMLNRALQVGQVRTLLDALPEPRPLLVVGGAPFVHDPDLWRQVGADAGGTSAASAIRLARRLLDEEAA